MTIVRHVVIDGVDYLASELPKEKRDAIFKELSRRPMETLGGRPAGKKTA